MEEYICKYCGKVCKNKNSLAQHEIRCKSNKNRIPSYFTEWNKKGAWNKGLTKSDPRVAKQSKSLKDKYSKGELISVWKGKKLPDDIKRKISESMKIYLENNPDKIPYLLNHSSKISYPEQYFIEVFKNEGIDLKYHKMINRYELDFYNDGLKKYVEIDGEQHYQESSIIRDKNRSDYLNSLGWTGMRIRWRDYQKKNEKEKKEIIEKIKTFLYP